ncbi:hypothetical protein Pelo_15585 [Pelomyxa schiedti]|nr:hypothetical protein Pelo_15585 [Pelomyxa schiedti]
MSVEKSCTWGDSRSTLPQPQNVAWARDQIVALCTGVLVGRCASQSPLRVLPHHVLFHDIGRNWVMGVARTAIVSVVRAEEPNSGWTSLWWFVSVSHTLGVVGIQVEDPGLGCDPRSVCGWVDSTHIVVAGWSSHRIIIIELAPRGKLLAEVEFASAESDGSIDGFKSNARWQLVHCNSSGRIVMWPRPLPATSPGESVKSISLKRGEKLGWIDVTDGNTAVVSVVKGRENVLWFVDLEKTHQKGVFVINQEFHLPAKCTGIYWSAEHGFIVSIKNSGKGSGFMILATRQVLQECTGTPVKVDDSHFHGESYHPIQVFSLTDCESSCCEFDTASCIAVAVSNGFVVRHIEEHYELADAVNLNPHDIQLILNLLNEDLCDHSRGGAEGDVVDLGESSANVDPWHLLLPAPDHVEWARDQFVALCCAGIVGRCASRSPVGLVPPHVLCHEIGRKWIMGARGRALVGSDYYSHEKKRLWWFICVSHTLGVVGIEYETFTNCHDWRLVSVVDQGHMVIGGTQHLGLCVMVAMPTRRVVARMRKISYYENRGVGNELWQLVYTRNAIAMWQKPLLAITGNPVREVSLAEGETLEWIDTLYGNTAAVSVLKGGKHVLWFVDMEKTHQQGYFFITKEFPVESKCTGVYWSHRDGFIATLKSAALRRYCLMSLTTHQVLRSCPKNVLPEKVNDTHFLEFTDVDEGTVNVFSTDDCGSPCRVLHIGYGSFFGVPRGSCFAVCNGMIAFRRRGRVELVDAVTGRSLWCQPVPDDWSSCSSSLTLYAF